MSCASTSPEAAHGGNLYKYSEKLKCMALTLPVAEAIQKAMAAVGCTNPNFSRFQTEIDSVALSEVLNGKVVKITFDSKIKDTPIELQAKRRALEIAYVQIG